MSQISSEEPEMHLIQQGETELQHSSQHEPHSHQTTTRSSTSNDTVSLRGGGRVESKPAKTTTKDSDSEPRINGCLFWITGGIGRPPTVANAEQTIRRDNARRRKNQQEKLERKRKREREKGRKNESGNLHERRSGIKMGLLDMWSRGIARGIRKKIEEEGINKATTPNCTASQREKEPKDIIRVHDGQGKTGKTEGEKTSLNSILKKTPSNASEKEVRFQLPRNHRPSPPRPRRTSGKHRRKTRHASEEPDKPDTESEAGAKSEIGKA